MSVLEPDAVSMPGRGPDAPTFPIVMRGFDRLQVRAFVDQLRAHLADETRRADQAEQAVARLQRELDAARHQSVPSYELLGSEAARVLEQAGASASILEAGAKARSAQIVEEAEAEAREVMAQAEQRAARLEEDAAQTVSEAGSERDRLLAVGAEEADRLRAQAEQEARTILVDAQDEAERTRAEADAERTAMQSETERLRDSRDRMVEFLGRIHTDLGAVLAETLQAGGETAVMAEEAPLEHAEAEMEAPASANGEAEPLPDPQTHPQ